MRPLFLIPLVLLLLPAAHAQQTGQNQSPEASKTYTLSVKAQLVVEPISVKDKAGNTIKGLTTKDFTLTEDGIPQAIRFAEFEDLSQAVAPEPPAAEENIKLYRQLDRTSIAPEPVNSHKYKDKRLLALYFDLSAMPPADQIRALAAAEKFIRTEITSADLVSILRFTGGAVDVLQDFTDNRDRLLSILNTMVVGEGQGNEESSADASTSDAGAAFGQDSGEFNIFNTDRQLSALQTAANMLGTLSEKKSLVYFASGLRLNGLDNQAQLHATVDAAIRAGVAFWPIDARGLVASAPLGDATKGSPGNQGMYSGTAAQAGASSFQQSQDTLFALAGDTGGKALLDNNDLGLGIKNAQQAISSYYILGYYTSNPALNGKFRHIKITVNPPDGNQTATLDYRQGYYAGKVFAKFNETDKERQLEDALLLQDPITDLTIALEIDYFQLNRAEYFVPISVKIPGRELALAKKGGADHTVIDFVGEIKDNFGGTTVTNIHDKVNIKLSDATAQELSKRPIEYDAGFTLSPGKYTIKFLARDDETGRIGTYQATFAIPNLNKVLTSIPTSTVVLASQLSAPADTLFNSGNSKDRAKNDAADPLMQPGGQRLIPSVTRVFSKDRKLYVFLQAYEQNSTVTQPIVAFVTFYKGGVKAFETRPIEVPRAVNPRLQTMPLNFSIPLGTLAPGEYDCQVTVLDPTENKTAFSQTPILIVP